MRCHCLSDGSGFRPDMLGMIGFGWSDATGVPFDGPVAGLRVGRIDGKFVPFQAMDRLITNQT